MKKKNDAKVMLGEVEFEVPEEVAMKMKELMAKVEEQGAELSKLASMGDEEMEMDMEEEMKDRLMEDQMEDKEDEEKEDKEESMDSMRAKIDMLQAQLKKQSFDSKRMDERLTIISNAQRVLGADYAFAGKSDSAIMKAVVKAVTPSMDSNLKGASRDYIKCAYDMALKAHKENNDSNLGILNLRSHVDGAAGPSANLHAAYEAFQNKIYGKAGKELN